MAGGAHRPEVSTEIENIGDQEKSDDAAQQPRRVMRPDIAGDTLAGDPADAGADFLNGCHQWPGEQHDPRHVIAELGARLRVGGDTAWIVVGGTGNPTWADIAQQPLLSGGETTPMAANAPGDGTRGVVEFGTRVRHGTPWQPLQSVHYKGMPSRGFDVISESVP
jgi:hypothetical protein